MEIQKKFFLAGSPRPSHNTLFLFVLASQNEHNHDQLTIYMLGFFWIKQKIMHNNLIDFYDYESHNIIQINHFSIFI